jgi:ATP-binding cassette, subfamily A (ABC1), member 3
MKRDMWTMLRNVAVGKAVIITTRELNLDGMECPNLMQYDDVDSMEEASALATKVGIIAKRMLGTSVCR